VMFGCGIGNTDLIRDTLYTQTKHVQFVIFNPANQNLKTRKDGLGLRDMNSFF